jgi:hypothetical protein
MKWLLTVLCVCGLLASVSGCIVGGTAIGQFDQNAATSRGLANKLNGSTMAQLQDPNLIYVIVEVTENKARADENFSLGLHGNAPKWTTPAVRPTTLPWTPVDANGR